MQKRSFLRTLGAGTFGLLAGQAMTSSPTWASSRSPDKTKHWAWVSKDLSTSDEEWQRLFANARRAGLDAVIPEVYDSRQAYYKSTRHPVAELWLERLIPLAASEGLEVHAWMWSMPCNQEDLWKLHPEWYCVNRKGETAWERPAYVDYYRFLCPSNPEVREFLKGTVTELGTIGGLEGIHLDYIRFPDVILAKRFQEKYGIVQDREYPAYDYCYCDVCREEFRRQYGRDPLLMTDPASDPEWKQFRYDLITRLVNTVLVPAGRAKGKTMTAAVFPNWESVRQQWTTWDIDGIMPMLYHGFYDEDLRWIRQQTDWGVRHMERCPSLYSGLFVPQLTPPQLVEAVENSLAGGARGISLFAAQSMTEDHWNALRSVVHP